VFGNDARGVKRCELTSTNTTTTYVLKRYRALVKKVNVKWDADRLDLIRLGASPAAELLSTEAGVLAARKMRLSPARGVAA
jgi:hypothetical protein